MNVKAWLHEIGEKVSNYNLFVPDENDYDDPREETADTLAIVKQQKYSTRLYILLLLVFVYVIFFVVFIAPQSVVVRVEGVTPALFDRLQRDHAETLSCPCSNTVVPYHDFTFINVSLHPVCSSAFVGTEWIIGLYTPSASSHLVMDFRTTAHAQFQLLADLCSLSQQIVSQLRNDIGQKQLVTTRLLPSDQVYSQAVEYIGTVRNSTSVQTAPQATFIAWITRLNSLITAANTNAHLIVYPEMERAGHLFIQTTFFINMSVDYSDDLYTPCDVIDSHTPSAFYGESYGFSNYTENYWPRHPTYFDMTIFGRVDGFFGACYALDALLASTLECLYDERCLRQLVGFFPDLGHVPSPTAIPTGKHRNVTVAEHVANLFLDEWSSTVDYERYFRRCASPSCTYTTSNQSNFTYTLVFLLSLYGGLTIILRWLSPVLVRLGRGWTRPASLHLSIGAIVQWLKQLNLFKSIDRRAADDVTQQRLTTRTYLILLAASVFTLLLFTSLSVQTLVVTERNPSFITHLALQALHPTTVRCPCSSPTISYATFLSLSPTFHEVCTSAFVSDAWLSLIVIISKRPTSWFTPLAHHLQLLSTICRLTSETLDNAVHQFLTRSLTTSIVLAESDFASQLNRTVDQFTRSLVIGHDRLIDTIHLFTQVDQPFRVPTNPWIPLRDVNLLPDGRYANFTFVTPLNEVLDLLALSSGCICATNPQCRTPTRIFTWDVFFSEELPVVNDTLLGMTDGCFTLDSFHLSTLECLYNSSNCLTTMLEHINVRYTDIETSVPLFSPAPLRYDPVSSRFPPATPLSSIDKEMLIERWNYASSFVAYYNACAPQYCTYTETRRTYTAVGVAIKTVSMIGGLIAGLRLLTPQLIRLALLVVRRKTEAPPRAPTKWSTRVKAMPRQLVLLVYNTAINLSIFPLRVFGNRVNASRAKRLGQLATRFYLVCLGVALVFFGFVTLLQPEVLTGTLNEPSQARTERLFDEYGNALECPCSLASSTYGRYLSIDPAFHHVCSSSFVSDTWRSTRTVNVSAFAPRDYRRFLFAHLQFLAGLCQLTDESVKGFRNELLSSTFVTVHLLPRSTFIERVHADVETSRSSALITPARLLFLLRRINHGNGIVSSFGSNHRFFHATGSTRRNLLSEPMVYDDGCSCALRSNCTTPAAFFVPHAVFLKGLQMGCTPTESFLASTLECFYDAACLRVIQQNVNAATEMNMLRPNVSRFPVNTSVEKLVDELLIESWSITTDYSAYFEQCSPRTCSYQYVQKFHSLYTISRLLSLYGGLSVVLKWICPILIYWLVKFLHRWNRRTNRVTSIHPAKVHSRTTVSTVESGWKPTNMTSPAASSRRRLLFVGMLLLIVVVAILIPSVYYGLHRKDHSTPGDEVSELSIAPKTMTTTAAPCRLSFDLRIVHSFGKEEQMSALDARDLNGDGNVDIIVGAYGTGDMTVLLGLGNGSFARAQKYREPCQCDTAFALSDVNNDRRVDLIIVETSLGHMRVKLGVGDGTFESTPIFRTQLSSSTTDNAVGDFNSDGWPDLAVAFAGERLTILLGNGNGTFREPSKFPADRNIWPKDLVALDLNADDALDLPFANSDNDRFGVFLGNGDGTFRQPLLWSPSNGSQPMFVAAAHFNGDGKPDVVAVNFWSNTIDIFLGNADGSVQPPTTYFTGSKSSPVLALTGDFNSDGHIDIAVVNYNAHNVGVLLNDGRGTFMPVLQFPVGTFSLPISIAGVDLNNDQRLDIAVLNFLNNNVVILLNTCH